MYGKAFSIVVLLVVVLAAPIVDAIACDDCKDIIPPRQMQQCLPDALGHSDCHLLSPDPAHPASPGPDPEKDLCPICANTGAAMAAACCGAPLMISHTNQLPKLIAFSDPSYSVIKPPQN